MFRIRFKFSKITRISSSSTFFFFSSSSSLFLSFFSYYSSFSSLFRLMQMKQTFWIIKISCFSIKATNITSLAKTKTLNSFIFIIPKNTENFKLFNILLSFSSYYGCYCYWLKSSSYIF